MPVGKAEGGQRLTSGLDGLFLRNGLDRVHEQLFDDYRRDRRLQGIRHEPSEDEQVS